MLLIAIWPFLPPILRGWLLLIVIALIGAGIFKANPITDDTPDRANTIHAICGMIVILTFPIVATLAVRSLFHYPFWLASQGILTLGAVLTWIGVVAFFASIIISRIIDPAAGQVGPHIYLGWPNRFMVVTYVIWILIVAVTALWL